METATNTVTKFCNFPPPVFTIPIKYLIYNLSEMKKVYDNIDICDPEHISIHMSVNLYLLYKVKLLSRVWRFVTPWTVSYQAPPSMGFSRQEYWSGLPFPSPGNFPDPGIELRSPKLQAEVLPSEPSGKT